MNPMLQSPFYSPVELSL